MKTGKYIDGLLKTMWEKAGMDPEFEAPMGEIRAAIADRDTQLKVTAENWHDDDAEEFDYVAKPVDDGEYKAKYYDLEARYKEAFFNGEAAVNNNGETTEGAIMQDQNTDIREDARPHTIDELITFDD